MSPLKITSLPVEVIDLIALHVVLQYPFRPPTQLLNFSLLNKQFYALLSPSRNLQLYANIFRSLFDVHALQRRFPFSHTLRPSLPPTPSTHSDHLSVLGHEFHPSLSYSTPITPLSLQSSSSYPNQLCNSILVDAYFERLALFKRMREFATHPPPVHPSPQRPSDLTPYNTFCTTHPLNHHPPGSISRDLWLIYLMILENDGLNWVQLLEAANITGFLLNYFHYEIYPSATAPGYPAERPEIAIALRLCHLFLDLEDSDSESNYWTSETGIETYLFALKPFTFASHQYDVAYAPCSIRLLPINVSPDKASQTLSHKLTPREKAALLIPIHSDSSDDEPSNPLVRTSQLSDPSPWTLTSPSDTFETSSHKDNSPAFQPTSKYSEFIYMGKPIKILPPLLSHVALLSFFWCNTRHAATPSTQSLGVDDQTDFFLKMMQKIKNLKSNDYDKEFLRLTNCLDPFESQGLPFDLFQNCFRGGWDGQFGFLDLTNFRQMLSGRLKSVYEGRYGDQNQVFKAKEFIVRIRDGKPVRFMDDAVGNVILSTRKREDQLSKNSNQNGYSDHKEKGCKGEVEEQVEPQESEIEHLTSMTSLLNSKQIEPILVKYDPSEQYELQIHGTGHSSWGRFQIKGRVRAWDGMLTFLKIYDAGRHGRWLYRGYYSSGDMIVGRWRDSLTSEAVDGYEGTFVLFKRN